MINLVLSIFALIQFYLLLKLLKQSDEHAARLTRLESQKPVKPEPKVVERVQPKQIWDKEIEGFNPKKPATVLPRSEEERNARVKTVREVNENVFEFDSKI